MKRYLVYYDKSSEGGISAGDYILALRKAKQIAPKDHKSHIRIRLAKQGTLLATLARQKDFGK